MQIRTLLVDDSPFMLATLRSILERDGRTTLVGAFTDGWHVLPEALNLTPDLVVLDLHLPHLNGAEATRFLKLLPKPPLVFIVSADDSPAARELCIASGADAFLSKSENLETRLRAKLDDCFGPSGSNRGA